MKIFHLAATLGGGANIAARRLHSALIKIGKDSIFYFGSGEAPDGSYIPKFQNKSFVMRNLSALAISFRNRQTTSGGFFPSPNWIRRTPLNCFGSTPSLVNLHWVPRWLDTQSFLSSIPKGLPVVWTLHDLIPITGGCHYPRKCMSFKEKCGSCPQLKFGHRWDASSRFHAMKRKLYSKTNLHLVANSEWTYTMAKESALGLFAKSIQMIHYGIDTDEYKPISKSVARESLLIPEGKFVIGFSCLDFHEHRKGADFLNKALQSIDCTNIVLLILGGGKWPSEFTRIQTISLGGISQPRLQSLFYSALDVFLMPSMIETFGNAALESMSCGTPVIAYPAGGLKDVVDDSVSGLIRGPVGDVRVLSEMVSWFIEHPDERNSMSKAARDRVVTKFSDIKMAQSYAKFYDQISPII